MKLFALMLAGAALLAACGSDSKNDTPKSPASGATQTTGGVRPSTSATSTGDVATAQSTPGSRPADNPGAQQQTDGNVPGAPKLDGPIQTTETGLRYIDEKVGDGPSPADLNARVTVHYTGWLVDGKKFDSSVDRGTPATFKLGDVIKGWQEGVRSMKVGGKRRLIIPSTLGYGTKGSSPTIPPNATLVFDVELISVQNASASQ